MPVRVQDEVSLVELSPVEKPHEMFIVNITTTYTFFSFYLR